MTNVTELPMKSKTEQLQDAIAELISTPQFTDMRVVEVVGVFQFLTFNLINRS